MLYSRVSFLAASKCSSRPRPQVALDQFAEATLGCPMTLDAPLLVSLFDTPTFRVRSAAAVEVPAASPEAVLVGDACRAFWDASGKGVLGQESRSFFLVLVGG